MENLELQRELEEQLRTLRIQLKLHENKVKTFETKATKDERKAAKRRREDFGAVDSQKRLRSAVSVVTKSEGDGNMKTKTEEDDVPVENVKKENPEDEEPNQLEPGSIPIKEELPPLNTTPPQQQQQQQPKSSSGSAGGDGNNNNTTPPKSAARAVRRGGVNPRDRRIFSTLLQGTLISFNRQSTDDKTLMKRKEVELKIEEKVASEQRNLLEAERQKIEEEKQRCLEKVAQVKEEIKQKELQLSKLKLAQHQQLLSGFLKTKATPPIYFYPGKTDEFTERVLSTKKKIEPPKETVPEESNLVEEVPVNPLGAEGDDVEVEAFTREREVGLPVVQPQEEEDMDEGRTEDDGKKN